MNIQTALIDILKDDTATAALVGTRIRSSIAWEEDALPYVVMSRLDEEEGRHLNGSDGLVRSTWSITNWGTTKSAAETLADAVRPALNNYRGTVGPTGDTTNIRTIAVSYDADRLQQKVQGSDDYIHGVGLTATVWSVA